MVLKGYENEDMHIKEQNIYKLEVGVCQRSSKLISSNLKTRLSNFKIFLHYSDEWMIMGIINNIHAAKEYLRCHTLDNPGIIHHIL